MTSRVSQPKNILSAVLVVSLASMGFVEVMDATVLNISVPDISLTYHVPAAVASWALTAYISLNAVTLPLSAPTALRFGRKRVLLAASCGFLCSLLLVRVASNIWALVGLRALQGAFGGFLQPVATAVLLERGSRSQEATMIAWIGFATTLGPILGPILGGWCTTHFGWRSALYLTVPLVVVSIVSLLLDDTVVDPIAPLFSLSPHAIVSFALAVSAFQVLLDSSLTLTGLTVTWTLLLLAVVVSGVVCIGMESAKSFRSGIGLPLLKVRHFRAAYCFLMYQNLLAFATIVLFPLFLQSVFGVSAALAGLLVLPRGLGALAGMALGKRCAASKNRNMYTIGLVAVSSACVASMTYVPAMVPVIAVIAEQFVLGTASAALFVTTSSSTYASAPRSEALPVSGIVGFGNSVSATLGISSSFWLLSHSGWFMSRFSVTPTGPGDTTMASSQRIASPVLHSLHGLVGASFNPRALPYQFVFAVVAILSPCSILLLLLMPDREFIYD